MAATYGAPGVYIEEQPSGSMPIEGVGTAVAAFVGFTETYDAEQGDPTDPDGREAAAGHQLAAVRAGLRRVRARAPCCRTPSAASSRTAAAPRYIVRIPAGGGRRRPPRWRCRPPSDPTLASLHRRAR